MSNIETIANEYSRDDLPAFRAGDSLRVNVRIREGEKERIQAFEGVCIRRHNAGVTSTFTVRKVSYGTEAGQFQEAGYSAIICGPGSINQAHQPNEYISEDQLRAGEAFIYQLIREHSA